MEDKTISISDLRKVKGIGGKAIERILEQIDVCEDDKMYVSEYNSNIKLDRNNIYNGDCLELMNGIEDKSVDMILCDLPYGTTQNKWDSVIDFDKLWKQYNRIIKDNGAIVLFGSEPFSTKLRNSNINMYKYDWIWKKNNSTGFQLANKRPMKDYEVISVFYKSQCLYKPQGLIPYNKLNNRGSMGDNWSEMKSNGYIQEWTNYPTQTLKYGYDSVKFHSTQKPTDLLEYLIKTYTKENQLVLDNTMGSGSTCVACVNTNRDYIGIEMDEEYFEIAKKRIDEAKMK